ncbi:unnamed protein product [Adineta ricciae]|uniref:Uncharacterized protein n=1 Tax=Adineta ricciae TaxID=249248 RepID=A0A813RPN6_ADIRI|nr:unnamed protein product [Adineta ricciae]CAF1096008.1 unnamed protein product [Adineta ricciae]
MMKNASGSFNPFQSTGLVAVVGTIFALVIAGTALGLGLGIGLHSDSQNLTLVTSTTISTSVTTASTSTTTSTILSTYQGSLTNSSAVYGGVNQSTTNYTFEAIQVYTNTTGTYTFTGTSGSNLQLYGYLYNGTFIPTNPQTNLITKSDSSSGSSLQFNLTSAITSFTEYILLVTSANQTSTGSFNITASGPGTILFTRRNVYSQFVNYGSTFNSGTDQVTNGSVYINLNNPVTGVDGTVITGYVSQVSMTFSVAPNATGGLIYIYVMNRTATTLTFTPSGFYQIPSTSLSSTTGVQTVSLPRNQLPVNTGQYIGVGQSTGGGSLAAVQNQNSASFVTSSFTSLPAATYTNVTNGVAFQYQIYTAGAVYG